ncbi:PREDICTED: gastric triacylglycerol lipase-like [Nicrophorus vespilloides]|uniref:Lipase n=1 Tax=Nicrophorus vespilloides TaxID=110193 RepID=A0ABM1M7J4_NICVS|nr:PREDICTED: gastric triacylglycerol lipase-like [Nicrophorus vespilloides]
MKFFLALFALVAVAHCGTIRPSRHHHLSQNVTDMICGFGYPVQNMTVQTKDGYILDLIRIPGDVNYRQEFEQKQRQEREVVTGKPAVVLMHGLLSSCEDFVIGGPSEGLAFVLANRGFDVFLANSRGSMYARKHTTLNPEKDAAFWRFSFEEIGTKDLPVIIDEILKVTQQNQVQYIGHMQGSTSFYVLASEKPEYNQKIEKMVSLGPVAFMKYSTNEMLNLIAEKQQSKSWQMKNLGVNEFHPSTDFVASAGQQDCMSREINERVCQNPYFLINGFESAYLNMTTIQRYVPRLPAGSSTKEVLHFTQLIKTGRFEKYSNGGQASVEEYDLTKVTVPVSIVYTPNDKISAEQDVKQLISKLPNVVDHIKIDQLTNNLDLLFSENVQSVVYSNVLNVLKGF